MIVNRGWRLGELEVDNEIKKAINDIILPARSRSDVLVWVRHNGGKFTVKEAYKWLQKEGSTTCDERPSSSRPTDNALWSKIWKLKVQPKIKYFL